MRPIALGSVRVPLRAEDLARMQRQGGEALRLSLSTCGPADWPCLIMCICAWGTCIHVHTKALCTDGRTQVIEPNVPWGVTVHS